MIKGNMWFEDKKHYHYYLECTKKVRNVFAELQKIIFEPLIKRVRELLYEQT